MEHHTLELGMPGNFFELDYNIWGPLATETWIKYCWDFAQKYDIEIKPRTPTLTLLQIASLKQQNQRISTIIVGIYSRAAKN